MDLHCVGSWLRLEAPAKLNLFLEIKGKREDGFHEIETLMTAISIHDTLFFAEDLDSRIRVQCDWATGFQADSRGARGGRLGDLPDGTDNIVYRAADRLRRSAGIERGAAIRIVKRVPSAAGLGGASSDAATTLLALNQVWRLHWPTARLTELAATIGSDVPFFLSRCPEGAHMAVCRGRGEKIELRPGLPALHLVIVKPPESLSTADVYRNCKPAQDVRNSDGMQQALLDGEIARAARLLFNRLQETAEALCPSLARVKSCFQNSDVLGHQLSGSGTSYFGICRNARHAKQVAARMRGARLGEVFYAMTKPAM